MAWKSWGIAGQSLKVNYAVHLKQHCSGQIKCLIHQNKNAIKSFFITVQQNTGLDLKRLKSQYELDCTIFFSWPAGDSMIGVPLVSHQITFTNMYSM